MDIQIMLKQMCESDISDSDIKAICKSRGFPAKEATSRDVFENFFISTIGITEVLDSLTYEEVVFLHLLNKINKEVDIGYFERLYDCAKPLREYNYGTFNQRYKETFKKVKANLVRKGVLIIREQEIYANSTKMERWRFCFPPEFGDFLPPVVKTSKIKESGDLKAEVLRDKLLEIIGREQKPSPLSNKNSFAFNLKEGNLYIGNEKFRKSLLLKWQQACWDASIKEDSLWRPVEMEPMEVALHAFSQLKEHEWMSANNLSVMLNIFTNFTWDAQKYSCEQICEVGWDWGCLIKLVNDGTAYYRLAENTLNNPVPSSPDNYLQFNQDGKVNLDLATIPYDALEVLASVTDLDLHDFNLRGTASPIKIGNSLIKNQNNSVFIWLKENSSDFCTAIEMVEHRWGKQIIHENLMIARIKDLSLKVQIEKLHGGSRSLISLPNDYIAFSCDLLPAIQKLVESSGHVIKKAGNE